MKRIGWAVAAGWIAASACGGKAVIDELGKGGSGGAGGGAALTTTTGTTGTTGVTTGTSCVDPGKCATCQRCIQVGPECDTANGPGACKCNHAPAKSSAQLWHDVLGCLCGADGASGVCGAICSKTCRSQGTDAATCMQCIVAAFDSGGACKKPFQLCQSDA